MSVRLKQGDRFVVIFVLTEAKVKSTRKQKQAMKTNVEDVKETIRDVLDTATDGKSMSYNKWFGILFLPKDGHITVWALCLKPYQMLQYSQTLNCSYINGSRRGTQTSKHGYLIVF